MMNPQHPLFGLLGIPSFPYQQPSHAGAEVPPRVRLAMEYLEHLRVKASVQSTMEQTSHEGFMEGKGQPISQDEVDARNDALQLLSDYFGGRLPQVIWDLSPQQIELLKQQEASNKLQLQSLKVQCPKCDGSPLLKGSCTICAGAGLVLIARAGGME